MSIVVGELGKIYFVVGARFCGVDARFDAGGARFSLVSARFDASGARFR